MEFLEFLGYLACNTFFTMLTAIIIYYFLKINFKLETKKNSLLILVLGFGLVNGIVASLWTNLFKISDDLQVVKLILLLVLSVIIIKFSLSINWFKSAFAFVILMLSTGVGSALIPTILHITPEEALSDLSKYITANIIIHVIAIIILVIIQMLIKLAKIVFSKTNNKRAPEC